MAESYTKTTFQVVVCTYDGDYRYILKEFGELQEAMDCANELACDYAQLVVRQRSVTETELATYVYRERGEC